MTADFHQSAWIGKYGGRLRRCLLILLALCFVVGELAVAQNTEAPEPIQLPPQVPMFSATELAAKVPPAKTEDVNSMAAILLAIYDVISGPAGGRDWSRFRSLFLPQARFTEVSTGPDGSKMVLTWNVDEFIRDAGEVFSKDAFYEKAIVNRRKVSAISHKCSAATNPGAIQPASLSSEASTASSC